MSSIRALSGPSRNKEAADNGGLVPMSLVNRDQYLKRHWSSWTEEDIELDRKRASERFKAVPARQGSRVAKGLIETISNTRFSLIQESIKLNRAVDRKAAIRSYVLGIDPIITNLHSEVKRGLMYLLKGEGSRWAPGGHSSIDLNAADMKALNEGLKIARERESRYRGRGVYKQYRGGRGGSFRGRGYGSSFQAGQNAAVAGLYQVLQDQRRSDGYQQQPRRGGGGGGGSGGGNGCYICGGGHFARSCPDRK